MRTFFYLCFVIFVCFNIGVLAKNKNEIVRAGIKLYDENKHDEAIKEFLKVDENDSAYIYALSELALTYIAKQEYDSVIAVCKEGLKVKSSHEDHLWGSLATAYDDLGESTLAIRAYKKAIELSPFNYLNHFNLGVTYNREEAYEKAIECYQEALRCNPYHSSSHLQLGLLSARQHHLTRAILSLETYLLLEPNSGRSNKNLVILDNIAQSYVDTSIGSYIEPIIDNHLFEETDHLVASRLVINANFDPYIDFNIATVKQTELLLEKLPFETSERDFWVELYFPFFKAVKENDELSSMLHVILRSIGNEDLNKWEKKNDKKLKEFYNLGSYLGGIKNYRYLSSTKDDMRLSVNYNDGNVVSTGNRDEEEKKTGEWIYYFANGRLNAIGNYVHDVKEGEWKYYDEHGILNYEENYVNGKIEGISKKYHPNSKLSYSLNYSNDVPNGIIDIRYKDGLLSETQTYKEGVQNGLCISFYASGDTSGIFSLKDGKLHGLYRNFHSNGQVQSRAVYKEGEMQGTYSSYHRNGKRRSEGMYLNGTMDGSWTYFYDNGKTESLEFYKDSVLVGKDQNFYRNENLESEYQYNDKGQLHGLCKYYDNDGLLYRQELFEDGCSVQLRSFNRAGEEIYNSGNESKSYKFINYDFDGHKQAEGSFKNGERDSTWTFYWKNGRTKEIAHYSNGKLEGKLVRYFKNGQLENQGFYTSGKENGPYQSFYIDGGKSIEGQMENGELIDYWNYYMPNGEIWLKKYFLEGKTHGWQTYYSANNVIYKRERFDQGDNIEAVYFNPKGDTINHVDLLNDSLYQLISNDDICLMSVGLGNFLFQDTSTWYYPDGSIKSKVLNKNGKEEGTLRYYYPGGEQWFQVEILNGERHGEEITWYRNGVCEDSTHYVEGELDWNIKFYENGKRKKESTYVSDELEGASEYYGPAGEKQICLNYQDGELISYQSAAKDVNGWGEIQEIKTGDELIEVNYTNGKRAYSCQLKNHLRHGEVKYYDEKGQILEEVVYAFGKLHGLKKVFYLNGNIKSEKPFYMGKLNGTRKEYYNNGKLRSESEYFMGDANGISKRYNEEGELISSNLYFEDLYMNSVNE